MIKVTELAAYQKTVKEGCMVKPRQPVVLLLNFFCLNRGKGFVPMQGSPGVDHAGCKRP